MYENIKPLKVNIISDLHYYSTEMGESGKAFEKDNAKSTNDLRNSAKILASLMEQLKKDDSDIVIVTGDTTNKAEPKSHEGITSLLRDLKKSGKKVYCITATHDFTDDNMTYLYDGDERKKVPAVKRDELYDLYKEFGFEEAISVHKDSLSFVAKIADGYRLFALNDDRNHKGASGFSDDCFKWITEQIKEAEAAGDFIIPVTHHPMLSPSPFYTIIGKSNIMGEAEKRIEEFSEMGVDYIFTGHTHMQDISYKITKQNKPFYDITTPAAVGYPANLRSVIFDPAEGKIHVDAVPIQCEIDGRNLQDHLEDKFFGMVRRVIEAAATDIETLAPMVTAFSVKESLIYKIGWILKPIAKILLGLKIGTAYKLARKESGLKKSEVEPIKNEKVVDFIMTLIRNLYGGDSPYNPSTPYYKITMGVLAIIDSVMAVFGLSIGKLLKGANSVQGLVEPLLYNPGICDAKATIDLKGEFNSAEIKAPGFIKSKKGLPIVIGLVLGVIILLPVILILGLGGFLVNYIKFHKKF